MILDPIDLQPVIQNSFAPPNLQSIVYNWRLPGNSQNEFRDYNVFRARRKKVSLELRLTYDADLSQIIAGWEIPQEALAAAVYVSGGTGATEPPPPLTAIKVKDTFTDAFGNKWLIRSIPEHKQMGQLWSFVAQQTSPNL